MFASKKVEPVDDGEYTPQQHLVAAVTEFKKLEASNQTHFERMYTRLASPFKVSTKPCEADRAAVLQCYKRVLRGTADTGEGVPPGDVTPTMPVWQLPLQECYAKALHFQQCVSRDALQRHLELSASFEEKRLAAQDKVVADIDASKAMK